MAFANKVAPTKTTKIFGKRTELLRQFGHSTTLHGIAPLLNSRLRFFKAVWLLLLLSAVGLFFYLMQRSVRTYWSYPYTTVIKKKYVAELLFPSVTVCVPSLFQRDKMFLMDDDSSFAEGGLNITACSQTAELRETLGIPCGHFLKHLIDNTEKQDDITVNQLDPVLKLEEFQTKFSYNVFTHGSGHISCHWKKKPCKMNFTATLTEYGYCYTFNAGRNSTKLLAADKPGREQSLEIEVEINSDDFYDDRDDGAVVILHENGAHFNPYEDGFFAQPGTVLQIAVKVEKEKRLAAPYEANCETRELKEADKYTETGCRLECRTQFITNQCGCKPPFNKGSPSAPVCSLRQLPCLRNAEEIFRDELCKSLCPIPCETTRYQPSLSFYLPQQTNTDGRDTKVYMHVAFNELSYTVLEQTPSFNIVNLLGEVGGNVGLLLGCSALTVFEFVEFVFNMLCATDPTKQDENGSRENETDCDVEVVNISNKDLTD